MKFKTVFPLGFAIGALSFTAWAIPFVLAQVVPPTESKGVSAKMIGAIPLSGEIDAVEGRQLRMRVVTLAPGGVFAAHNHQDRPSVEYVMKGTATEVRGDVSKEYREGDAVLSDRHTTHWWRNDGTEPVVIVAADVFHSPQ